jgi:hypothetical protein
VFPDLPQAISDSQFLVPRLTRRQMQEVIEKPLLLFGGKAAPDLVNQILNDVGTDPDQLPLMQHALMRTWFAAQARWSGGNEEKVLALGDYSGVGRFSYALSLHLEEAWSSLADDRERRIARQLFLCLSERAGEGALIRRMVKLGEVAAVAKAETGEVIKVVRVFQEEGRNFIMASPPGALRAESVLDISHEALLRQWARLRSWLEEETESVAEYLRLVDSAQRRQAGGDLLQGRELERAREWQQNRNPTPAWAERYQPGFPDAVGYLDESQQAEAEKTRRARNARRTFRACVAAACVILAGITFWAWTAQKKAVKAQTKAEALLVSGYLKAIGNDTSSLTSQQEIDSLWDIALIEEDAIWVKFVEHAFSRDKFARQLLNRMDYAAHALVGLSLKKREVLLDIALRYLRNPETNPDAKVAAAQLSTRFVGEKRIAVVAQALVAAMQAEKDADKLSSLGRAFGSLDARLPGEAAAAGAKALVTAMQTETDYNKLSSLGQALGSLGARLPGECAAAWAKALVS